MLSAFNTAADSSPAAEIQIFNLLFIVQPSRSEPSCIVRSDSVCAHTSLPHTIGLEVAGTLAGLKESGSILFLALWNIVHYDAHDKEDHTHQYQVEDLLIG
jgi:hypothetical protein